MNKRLLFVSAVIVLALAAWFMTQRPLKPPPPARTPSASGNAKPVVPIEDQKTIDFSSGKPVVTADPKQKEIIDRAVADMKAAAADVTFPATTTTKK